MKKIKQSLSWCLLHLSLWLHNHDWLNRLADWMWITAYRLRAGEQPDIQKLAVSDEWSYDWIYHYNSYTGIWSAYHREDSAAYWNHTATRHKVFESNCVTGLLQKLRAEHQSTNSYEYDNGY